MASIESLITMEKINLQNSSTPPFLLPLLAKKSTSTPPFLLPLLAKKSTSTPPFLLPLLAKKKSPQINPPQKNNLTPRFLYSS
jgi:hypothetical protein